MNSRTILKEALKDPRLNIDVLGPSTCDTALQEMQHASYLSEWRHTQGRVSYEYHMHLEEKGLSLKALYDKEIKGGNPKLVRVYAKNDLESFIQVPSKA
jgi:hypothetical protein